jgi:hypothetical protein
MWSRRKSKADPAEPYVGLRQQVLTVDAGQLGLAPTMDRPHVWGVLMETGYPEAVATLVVLADGTTSLYFSNGGGVIGAGTHDVVRAAGDEFLLATEAHVGGFTAASAMPLPDIGCVRFYVRTFEGTLTAEASEDDLGEDRHGLSPLFHAGHAVISAVRTSTPEE